MSNQQTPGNRLLVEKWSLGARFPQSLKWPFSSDQKNHFWQFSSSAYRLPGLSNFRHNDLIVFNSPASPSNTPVNQRPVLLSRCVALPGDFVRISGYHLFINDIERPRSVDALICFSFRPSKKDNVELLLKNLPKEREIYQREDTGFIFLARHEYLKLIGEGTLKNKLLKPYISSYDKSTTFVPFKGYRICLNKRSFEEWQTVINRYEGVSLAQKEDGSFEADGNKVTTYTFKQNYFFVLNDHQGYLNDSRTLGLIPETHLIGRACLILFSPANSRFLQKIRSAKIPASDCQTQ